MSYWKRSAVGVLLCVGSVSAFALPGELDAVVRHCGEPLQRSAETSQVTGKPQRDLIYKNVTLHFEPEEGGWSFTTAWKGHFPVTRGILESEVPCFKTAMDEIAAAPRQAVDPTIADQTVGTAPMVTSTWGIPHVWSAVLCVVLLVLVIALFPRRNRGGREVVLPVADRPFRKPTLRSRIRGRVRPPDSPVR